MQGLIGHISPRLVLGCALCFGIQNALAQDFASTKPGTTPVKVQADVRYCDSEGKAGLCDVYSPGSAPPESGFPVVVVVHGGGWISGDKWTLEGYSRQLARAGMVAITINYRLAPAFKFPAQVDDVRHALVWTAENAERLSIDINRLALFGYSAGGHLSALVACLADEPISVQASASDWKESDEKWKKLPGIRAVCAGGPPCDFRSLPMDNQSLAFFLGGSRREKPKVYTAASPAAHISVNDPVTQIIHGENDVMVAIEGSLQFHEAQIAAGVDSRMKVMRKQGHMFTFLNPKTGEVLLAFFREVLLNVSQHSSLRDNRE